MALIKLTTPGGLLYQGKKIAIDPSRIVQIEDGGEDGCEIVLANGETFEVKESFEHITILCAEAVKAATPPKADEKKTDPENKAAA